MEDLVSNIVQVLLPWRVHYETMASAMIRLLASIIFLIAVVAEGQPINSKRATARCVDSKFYSCHEQPPQNCPDSCPSYCAVDCNTCMPVCVSRPPPHAGYPPPTKHSPHPPPPPKPKHLPPPPKPKHSPPPPKQKHSPPPPLKPKHSPPPPKQKHSPPPPPKQKHSPPPPPKQGKSPTPPTPTRYPPPSPTATASPPPLSPPPPSPTLSPPPSTSSPPPKLSGKIVSCKNKDPRFNKCYRMEQRCPSTCPDSCEVDCVTCSPICNCNRPGTVCQDPRFVGADGLTFYFHGKKDRDFCIVSDSNVHINAHFIGKKNGNMTRDFTWVQSLGILFDNHQIFIGAKKTAAWDDAIDHLDLTFDGQPIILPEGEGTQWQPTTTPRVSITRFHDTNAAVIEVEGNFQIKATVVPITEKESRIHKYGITNEDCFAHLDMSFKFYSLSGVVNGVLGQTYASNYVSRVKMGVNMPVLGGDKEFASSNIFSTDCAVARFRGTPSISVENFGYENLNCASGLDGGGVVCKR